ncbi:MAG: polysulfide reductase NrfD, partial [Actinomycetota bacterium]|nr:polysulfide reductase NrfD [Actinomycetota bacterium]
LIRPQPRSWLVKGGFVLTGYGAALALALVFGYLGNDSAVRIVGMISVLLGAATAGYTAFLFSESRGRDLWQSPLLLPQLLVQAAMLGAGFAVVVRSSLATSASHAAIPLFVGLVLLHSLLVSAEVFTGHPSANAKLAHWEMTRGSMAGWFWLGNLGVLAGVAALLQPEIGVALCYAGMVAYEHSYVRSAQLVPLA